MSNSEFLNIQQKNDKFFVKGNLKNKKNKINSDIILLIFNNNLESFDFSNSKFDSTSEFSFDLSKKFKIRNLKVDSKLNLDELILKYNLYKIKNYIKDYNNLIKLKESKLNIRYSEKKFLIDGTSEFYIEENFKNLLNFQT